jgi:hypothetical protein
MSTCPVGQRRQREERRSETRAPSILDSYLIILIAKHGDSDETRDEL